MSLGEAGPRCVVRWVEQAVKREQGSWAPRQELGFSSEGTAVCVVLSRILGSEPRTLALGAGGFSLFSTLTPAHPPGGPFPACTPGLHASRVTYIGGARSNSDRNEPSIISQVSQATNTGARRWLLCHQQPPGGHPQALWAWAMLGSEGPRELSLDCFLST